MRILLVNPNMTGAMTDSMAALAIAAVPPGTEIIARTSPRGFPYISSLAEAQIAGAICLEILGRSPARGCRHYCGIWRLWPCRRTRVV